MKTYSPYTQVGMDMQFSLEINISVLSYDQTSRNNGKQKLFTFWSPFFFIIFLFF